MSITATPPVNMQAIDNEFANGVTKSTLGLSMFIKGGTYVKTTDINVSAVPTSLPMNAKAMLGTAKVLTSTVTLTNDSQSGQANAGNSYLYSNTNTKSFGFSIPGGATITRVSYTVAGTVTRGEGVHTGVSYAVTIRDTTPTTFFTDSKVLTANDGQTSPVAYSFSGDLVTLPTVSQANSLQADFTLEVSSDNSTSRTGGGNTNTQNLSATVYYYIP